MIPFHAVQVRIAPKAPLGEIVRALAEREGPPQEWFLRGATPSATAADRVRKFLPSLAPLCGAHDEIAWLREPWRMYLDANGPVDDVPIGPVGGPPPDLADVLALADGIPRRFPCDRTMFVWRDLPWLGARDDLGPLRRTPYAGEPLGWYDTPEPMLGLSRNPMGVATLRAWVRADVGADPRRAPVLPTAVVDRLSVIGKVADQGLVPRFEAAEAEAIRTAAGRVHHALRARENQVPPLPHHLPDPGEPNDLDPLTRDHRTDGDRVLVPLGYKAFPAAGQTGLLVWARTTRAGNRVEVHVDVGTHARRVSARMEVVGLGWREWIAIPFSEFQKAGRYAVNDDATYARLMDNVGVIVAHLDANVVPDVERELPPTPRWWKLPPKATSTP